MSKLSLLSLLLVPLATSLVACGEDGSGSQNAEEVISRVELVMVPMGGGASVTAVFDDPDGDGGEPPTIDAITLAMGTTYATSVRFLNALGTLPGDTTLEVSDGRDVHQVFFTGTAVDGPASDHPGAALTHAYADTDVNGLPIGLESTLVAAPGTGDLTITLRHLPPVNDQAVKTAALAGEVRASGFTALAGATDAQVTFPVAVAVP